MKKIELLAPARGLAGGMLAITCGADAVYIGAAKFSARSAAGNSLDDIRKLVEYAHQYYAKVYAAVNTILSDDELEYAVKLIHALHAIGVDGVIIQDVGLLEYKMPPLPIIASTQMHNNTPEKVKFLQDTGFKRAILARELSLQEISAISSAAPDIELEAFVHGAICVCYSGQCYLSYALGGRSGNRGACAQPCRKKYELVDENGVIVAAGKHFLSPRDLNLSARLSDLLDANVTLFKIEGRLKDNNYIANVVSKYRELIDVEIAKHGWKRASSGKSTIEFTPNLKKTFNRDYTEYFIDGVGNKVGGIDTPKNRGELLGIAIRIVGDVVYLRTAEKLHNGDGLCWFDANGELTGAFVNNVSIVDGNCCQLKLTNTIGIEQGADIYRNIDIEFTASVEKSAPARKVAAVITLTSNSQLLHINARDEDGNTAEMDYEYSEFANNIETAKSSLQQSFAKSGDTIFACQIDIDGLMAIPFIRVAQINALRRDILQRLHDTRANNYQCDIGGIQVNNAQYPAASLDYHANVFNSKAKAFYRRHGVNIVYDAAESGLDMNGRQVMRTRYCIRKELDICLKQGTPAKKLFLRDENYELLELRCDCANCEMHVIYRGRK